MKRKNLFYEYLLVANEKKSSSFHFVDWIIIFISITNISLSLEW